MESDISSTQSTASASVSSSTVLDTSYGSTSATVAKQQGEDIKPTATGSLSTDYDTKTVKHDTLHPSFKTDPSSSSQFAMQHATRALPSNSITMATTSYTSEDSSVNQNLPDSLQTGHIEKTVSLTPSTSPDTSLVSIATKSSSVPKSVHPSKSVGGDGAVSKDLKTSLSSPSYVTEADTVTSKYEPSISDTMSATSSQPAGQADSVSMTSSPAVSSYSSGSSAKSPVTSVDYSATSRDLYHTMTPSKTAFSSSVLDSMSFKTTPVASLSLTPSVKPVTTASGDSTPLFGGNTNDILLYVAVPACGVGLLIFLIICIVCIRRRKSKKKGSPARHPVQDLWVNANAEVPLTPLDHHRDIGINGGEVLGGHRLSGCVTYEAVYDFPGELETHLTLRRGDVVHVHRKEDNGWWRGTIGDKTGWFPNNYVQAVLHDYLEEENEVAPHNELNISSFMVGKDGVNRHSMPTEDEIKAEPIYCKIKPKNRRKSEPKLDEKSPYKHPQVSRENTPIPIDEGTKFVALYAYTAQLKGEIALEKGDIILGKEKDRNGWMHGVKEATGQEGWFPAVYVDEIIEKEEMPLPEEHENKAKPEPDPTAYKHLEANTKQGNNGDWVGILHKAIHTFTGEKAGDLHFSAGDMVTVYQILENGWWLGSKDDVVGWFPGSYVEMVGHQSPKPNEDESKQSLNPGENETITTEKNPNDDETKQSLNPVESETTTTEKETKSPDNPGKIRPARKAPPPPDLGASSPPGSKIPKIARPNRKAPLPPVSTSSEPEKEKMEQDHDPLYDVVGKKVTDSATVANEQKDSSKTNKSSEIPVRPRKEKPKVPLRYVKPRIVSVPRNSVNLSDFHFEKEPSRSHLSRPQAPPPPKPDQPIFVSQDKIPAQKENLQHSLSHNEEQDNSFNISGQRKFNAELKRQDSSDVDEVQPYKSLSSFGSTFGKKEAVPLGHGAEVSKAPSEAKTSGIPKLSRQALVQDEVSPSRNVIVHEELKMKERQPDENNSVLSNASDQTELDHTKDSSNKHDTSTEDFEIIKTPDKYEHENLTNSNSAYEPNDVHSADLKSTDQSIVKSTTPVSKIPKLPSSDTASRIPMTHSAKKKLETSDNEGDLSHDSALEFKENADEIKLKDNDAICEGENFESTSPKIDNSEKMEKFPKAVNGDISDTERPRTNSMDKPPVAPKPKQTALPKVLPKPRGTISPQKKGPEDIANDTEHHENKDNIRPEKDVSKSPSPEAVNKSPSPETVENQSSASETPKTSKIPQGSKIAQKSPALKGKASKIPASPKVARKIAEPKDKLSSSEMDTENKTQPVNLKQKPESPSVGRKIPRHRTFSNESPSLRNRSNSPHSKTGIPSPNARNRSKSPATAPKPSKLTGLKSPSGIPKSSNLPKKQDNQESVVNSEPNSPVTAKSVNNITDAHSSDELESAENKPDRPSKPPRIQKQKSADAKPAKQGKSLLPVIHKSMDSGSVSGGGTGKPKSGIPTAKPPRPPQPKSTSHQQDSGVPNKKTLYQAVKSYTAQCEGELSFSEGTFIKELSDCDRPGWYVGMLADGTTGIYPVDHLKPSPVAAQSEA